ncbi:MAG: DUF6521 family protein [Bacteroidales bacterium]|nr:DUF6521 family protein [Bacteroidales bacterium]
MGSIIENIATLQRNVFILTPLLVSFYQNLKPKEKNILLAYFVFPLVLNNEFKNKIKTFNSNSNMSRITKDKDIMAGFEDRFHFYYDMTNKCLQYAINCKWIKIKDDLSVSVENADCRLSDPSLNDSFGLASKLYKIFNKDVVNTYYAFGIKGL